ncbi:hypothetical protein BJX76DRAFT_347914 [Aspergillus varians]
MSRYAGVHANPNGPGDARPTAHQIIRDENLEGQMTDKVTPQPSPHPFLITGCSAGTSTETARTLAKTGTNVFVGTRSLEKDQTVSSVRAAAESFLEKSHTLDVYICNAGVMLGITRWIRAAAYDELSRPFLLFYLLKEALLEGTAQSPGFRSRVVNVSSNGHHHASEIQRYTSKEHRDGWASNTVVMKFIKSPEQGASTTVLAAVGSEEAGFVSPEVQWEGVKKHAYDEEKESTLWELTLGALGIQQD